MPCLDFSLERAYFQNLFWFEFYISSYVMLKNTLLGRKVDFLIWYMHFYHAWSSLPYSVSMLDILHFLVG